MGVFRIYSDNRSEVFNRFLMIFYHLISFGSFMDVTYVEGDSTNTESERENSLFKFLNSTVG